MCLELVGMGRCDGLVVGSLVVHLRVVLVDVFTVDALLRVAGVVLARTIATIRAIVALAVIDLRILSAAHLIFVLILIRATVKGLAGGTLIKRRMII